MDPAPSPFSRAGRMFWSVWSYVTEAVGRYLRPEVIDNDGQKPKERDAETNANVEGAEETQTVPITISAKNITRSTVTWEECDSNNGVGPAKENVRYIVQFTGGRDGPTLENDEGEIEEQIADAGLLVAKEMSTEEEEVKKECEQPLIVTGTDEALTDETEEYDYFGSLTPSDNTKETGGIMAQHDERQNADETLTTVLLVKDWSDGEEMITEDAGQLRTSSSPERDSNIHREDLALARQEESKGMEHDMAMAKETESERHTSVSEQAGTLSESEDESGLRSDGGLAERATADVQKAVLLCEEILDENGQSTCINIPEDEEQTRTDEEEFSNSEADTVNKEEPGDLAHVTLSDNMEETQIRSGLEKEIMAHDERYKVDETFRNDQLKDGHVGEEVLAEEEAQSSRDACAVLGSESEESSGLLCRPMSPEDDNIYREDVAMVRQEEEEVNGMKYDAVRKEEERHPSASKPASALSNSEDENDHTSDEGLIDHGAEVQKLAHLCEEILDAHRNVCTLDRQDNQLTMTTGKRAPASDHEIAVGAQVQMVGERLQKTENNDANDLDAARDRSISVENKQDVEIEAQIDDEDKEITMSYTLEFSLEAEVVAEDGMDTEHTLVGERITENMEKQSKEPSVMSEHIDHLTVTDRNVLLTEIDIPPDEKTRPDEDMVSHLTDMTLSDNLEGVNRFSGHAAEIGTIMASDERQNVTIRWKDENDGEEMLFEDETQSLSGARTILPSVSEEASGQLCMSVSSERDSNIYREDPALLRQQEEEEGEGMEDEAPKRKEVERYTSISEQASTLSDSEDENNIPSNEGSGEHEAVLLREVIWDENSDVTASELAPDTQLQMTYNETAPALDHDITVDPPVMGETLLTNDLNTTEDGSTAAEREQGVEKIDVQIDDEGKGMSTGISLDWRFEVESRAEDDTGAEHIEVSEPMTENMEIQVNREQREGGNESAIKALLGTATQTNEYVAVKKQNTELLGICHATVNDGKTHLTDQDFPKIRPEEKVLISEEDVINKKESALTTIALKSESNNGGEIVGVLQSSSPETSDRLVVVPLEPNSVVCEETQEGVPGYDNNRHEAYDDKAQRMLEIQTTQLPEEVGSKQLESFITTAGSGKAGHIFVLGEGQSSKVESAVDIQNMFDMVAEGHTATGLPREKEEPATEPMDETPALLSACTSPAEFGHVHASLGSGTKHSKNVSQTDASSQGETFGTVTELLVETEEVLAEMNNESDRKSRSVIYTQNNTRINENVDELSGETVAYPDAELHTEKVTGFVYEPIDPTVLEENCSQVVNVTGSSVETKVMEEASATLLNDEKALLLDVQYAGLNVQDIGGPEIRMTTPEQDNSPEIINLQHTQTSASKTTTEGEENGFFAGSETVIYINTDKLLTSITIDHEIIDENKHHSTCVEKPMNVGFCNESLDINSEPEVITSKETEITIDGEADKVTELLGHDERGTDGYETDDEILDLWVETVLCKDANNSDPLQTIRTPTERDPEENEETMSERTEKEPGRVSINNKEPETKLALRSETEMPEISPPPLLQSGYTAGGQFPCKGAWAENETALTKLSAGMVSQAIHKAVDSMSEIVSVKSSEIEDGDMQGTQDSCIQEDQSTLEKDTLKNTLDVTPEAREDELSHGSQENRETDDVELMGTETGSHRISLKMADSGLQEKTICKISEGMEEQSRTCAHFQGEAVNGNIEDKPFGAIELNITNEMEDVHSEKTDESQEAEPGILGQKSEPVELLEEKTLTESDLHNNTCLEGQDDQVCDILETHSRRRAASSPVELSTADDSEESATPLPTSGDQPELDFTPQKSRIAIKNPDVRPRMDPRAIIQMPSVEPAPHKSSDHLPMKGLAAVPLGGLGMGIKLPGFGAGFPGLKKTNTLREDNRTDDFPQKDTETTLAVTDVSPEPAVVSEGRIEGRTESEVHKKMRLEGQDQECDVQEAHSRTKAASPHVELSAEEQLTPLPTPSDQPEFSTLDFTPQKTRIAIKNPHARPPKDPRALLQMPSLEPSPSKPSVGLPVKGLAGVPMGGMGIGIKLPGLGAGFPVLKKTNMSREENLTEDGSQKDTETKPEVNEGSPTQDVAKPRPKWMPPGQPGFGNPLMSELKNKLKKTTKE